jgi:small subunit ribosomal protein S21
MGRRTPVNIEVIIRHPDQTARMIKKFTKKVKKSGLFDELKSKEYYEKPSDKKRREKKKRKRVLKKLQQEKDAKNK